MLGFRERGIIDVEKKAFIGFTAAMLLGDADRYGIVWEKQKHWITNGDERGIGGHYGRKGSS